MDDAILVYVIKPLSYLPENAFGPVFWQPINIVNAKVVHEVATLRQLCHDVGI